MLLTLDSSSDKPFYVQIRDQIRERIVTGALKVGDRLEPSRELAKRLGVHRTTVGNAYAELESEGLIRGTVGRGTFVSPFAVRLAKSERPTDRGDGDLFWDGFLTSELRDDALSRLMASAAKPGAISFATGHVSAELIPVDFVRRATDVVLRRKGAELLQYGPSDGYPPLKKYLQGRMRRDGIPAQLDEILVTNGCQQSLDLIRRTLIASGDAVVCENPTYTGLWHLFASPDVRLIGVPVHSDGMDLDYLQAVLEMTKVKLILCSPSFQNPTGRTMPVAARRRLLSIAGRAQVPVVEDDVYGALRYAGRDIPSLKSLDTSGLVIYLNSFSKIGFPGFRVGWIVASPRVVERLRAAKQRSDLHTNTLAQGVLEELGRRGWLDKWIRRTRKVYESKLAVLRRAVGQHFPREAHCVYPEGGMSVWVELPAGADSDELLVKAQDRGVIFAPGSYFYFQQPRHDVFRLCFTSLAEEQIECGVSTLGELLKAAIRKNGTGKDQRQRPTGANVALV